MSVMYKRLLIDIDGNSGIMPLSAEYDPEHYWHNDKEEHIQNIKNWIDLGAEDMFGNLPVLPNKVPEMRGCIAFEPGQTSPLSRSQPRGTIYVPSNLNFVDKFDSIDEAQFSKLIRKNDAPFIQYSFLKALENSGCVGRDLGWTPKHLVKLNENERGPKQLQTHLLLEPGRL